MNGRHHQSPQALQQAFTYLNNALSLPEYRATTKNRDKALLALDTLRVSEPYEDIQARFGHEQLTPHEYVFYALVTDNVMTLDAHMLTHALQQCDDLPYRLRQSLRLTVTAVRFAKNETPALHAKLHQELINELCKDRRADNLHRSVFTNLAGIRLTGFDSTVERTNRGQNTYSPDLSFCDLRGATFSNCDFDHLALRYCDVSDATFENVRNTKKHGGSEFDLIFSFARRTTFDNVVAAETTWQYTDFSDAEFNHCNLANTHVSGSNFSRAKLHHSKITGGDRAEQRNTNFSHADLTTAEIRSVSYYRNTYHGAHFLNPATPAMLQSEVDRVTKQYLECESHLSQRDVSVFQELIRKDVERYVASLDMTDVERNDLLKQTLEHDLFHYVVMEPTSTLVAGGFPRQERPLVLFSKYDDKEHAFPLKGASLALYQSIYARGMELLGKLATAIKTPTDLQLYTSELEVSFISHFEDTKQQMKKFGAPDDILNKSATDLLDTFLNNVPEKLAGADPDILKAILLSHLTLDHTMIQAFQSAAAANQKIDTRGIYNKISSFHPLTTLGYDATTNCLTPYCFSRNNGAYHSADELIKYYTNPARLQPPAVAVPASKVSATMFAVAANDNNVVQNEELHESSNLRASN